MFSKDLFRGHVKTRACLGKSYPIRIYLYNGLQFEFGGIKVESGPIPTHPVLFPGYRYFIVHSICENLYHSRLITRTFSLFIFFSWGGGVVVLYNSLLTNFLVNSNEYNTNLRLEKKNRKCLFYGYITPYYVDVIAGTLVLVLNNNFMCLYVPITVYFTHFQTHCFYASYVVIVIPNRNSLFLFSSRQFSGVNFL